jgi:hypothetical protein
MKEQNDVTKMEFLLTLNDNIVVQRYFNVRNYNPNARKSLDVIQKVNEVATKITEDLKKKTLIYMIDNQSQIEIDPTILDTSNTDGPEYFNIFIKLGNETICHKIVDAKIFPPKIRYTVDVRPHLKSVLRSLTDIFSSENLTHAYLNYQLV